MAIDFSCPGCGKNYTLPDKFAGKRATCKKCNSSVQVPAPSDDVFQLSEKDLELTDDDLEVVPETPDLFGSLDPFSPTAQTSQTNVPAAPAVGFGALSGTGGTAPAAGFGALSSAGGMPPRPVVSGFPTMRCARRRADDGLGRHWRRCGLGVAAVGGRDDGVGRRRRRPRRQQCAQQIATRPGAKSEVEAFHAESPPRGRREHSYPSRAPKTLQPPTPSPTPSTPRPRPAPSTRAATATPSRPAPKKATDSGDSKVAVPETTGPVGLDRQGRSAADAV